MHANYFNLYSAINFSFTKIEKFCNNSGFAFIWNTLACFSTLLRNHEEVFTSLPKSIYRNNLHQVSVESTR